MDKKIHFLTYKQMERLSKMSDAAYRRDPMKVWQAFYEAYLTRDAEIHLPLGELMNPKIAGFLWAWKMKGQLSPVGLTGKEGLNAQGLEGKVVIHTLLSTALIVWREVAPYRVAIKARLKL